MDKNLSQKISEYSHFFSHMQDIKEIDHIEGQFFGFLVQDIKNYDFSGIAVIENRMAISFGVFDVLYPICRKVIFGSQNLTNEEFEARLEEINLASRIILCLNGEMNSAINRRLRMLELNLIKNIEEELHFVKLLTLKFKKSSALWYYRQKLIKKYFDEKGVSKEEVEKRITFEDGIIEEFLVKYPRNYYGWGYKKFLIDEYIIKSDYNDLLWKEYLKIKEYCEKNVHNFSAFHLLGTLTYKIAKKENKENMIKEQITWANNLIKKYEDLYLLESLEIKDKGIKYHELESVKRFLVIMKKF